MFNIILKTLIIIKIHGSIDCSFIDVANSIHYIPNGDNSLDLGTPNDASIKMCSEKMNFISVRDQDAPEKCFPEKQHANCDENEKYRSIDGSCNNIGIPIWGMSNIAYVRLLHPSFQDGDHKRPLSKAKKSLPDAREISQKLFQGNITTHDELTEALYVFGQMVMHDVAGTAEVKADCCKKDLSGPVDNMDEDICMPTLPKEDDPFYGPLNIRCLSVPRHKTTTNLGCKLKPSTPINANTGFLDMSFLYGSTTEMANSLRTNSTGKLRSQKNAQKREFPAEEASCPVKNSCFMSGDFRTNLNPDVVVSTTIYLRMHNKLTDELAKMNPCWDDEKLYQEARRINIAMYQHVTYNEYLPLTLGLDNMKKDGRLLAKEDGYSTLYDRFLNPQTLVNFQGAIGRIFHSLAQGKVLLRNEDRKITGDYQLRDHYFDSRFMLDEKLDVFGDAIRGYTTDACELRDKHVTEDMSDFLFKSEITKFGNDIVSIDINRGRDDGIAPYNSWREACGLCPAKTFDDFKDLIPSEEVEKLRSIYDHPDDVDLYVGATIERSLPGTIVGPTMLCLNVESYHRWRNGDRFYYEFNESPGAFTLPQLKEIKKTTFAHFVCRTANEDVKNIQAQAFLKPSDSNPVLSCDNIRTNLTDLSLWKDKC